MEEIESNQTMSQSSLNVSLSNTSNNNESKTNLIVNYLPQTMTSDELKNVFQSVGAVESCKLIKDKNSHQSLCYGFVNYANIEDAEKAIKKLNGLKIENKVIKVSYARPSCESIKGANLYICGLPKMWSLEDMNSYFGSCGKIITSRILFNSSNGESKGVGFIRFDQRNEADLAINKLQGTIPEGSLEPITVKFANYPTESKTKLVNQFQPLLSAASYLKLSTNSTLQTILRSTTNNNNLSNTFQSRYPIYGEYVCNNESLFNINQSASSSCISTNTSTGWCIFVYNLAAETEESVLWQLFGPFGAVQNVRVIRDFQSQKCKGFGFVTMTSYDDAINAINALNGISLANRVLQVSFKTNLTKS